MKAKKKKGIFYSHFFHSGSSRCALFFLSPICVSFVVQSSSRPVVVVFSQQHPRTKSARMDATLLHSFSRYVLRHIEPRVCSLSLSLSLSRERERERERGFDSSGTQCLRFPIYIVVATSRVFAKSRTRSSN